MLFSFAVYFHMLFLQLHYYVVIFFVVVVRVKMLSVRKFIWRKIFPAYFTNYLLCNFVPLKYDILLLLLFLFILDPFAH